MGPTYVLCRVGSIWRNVYFETHCRWVKKFWSCHSFVRLLPNRDLPNPSPIFSIRSANTWHYLQRNQLHLKDRIMKSTFTKQFTTKFQLSSVIFKKWIGFCLINASSVSHIFFLVSAEFFCKGNSWLSSWGWAFIWDNNNSQAREKLIVSWRKSGNFKISYLNGNVHSTYRHTSTCICF